MARLSKMTAEGFNGAYKVGQVVRYYARATSREYTETHTTSEARELAPGKPVVNIQGQPAAVALSALEPVLWPTKGGR